MASPHQPDSRRVLDFHYLIREVYEAGNKSAIKPLKLYLIWFSCIPPIYERVMKCSPRRIILGETPTEATIYLHGSFAETYRGHGTDKAIIGGLLGFSSDDERIRQSFRITKCLPR